MSKIVMFCIAATVVLWASTTVGIRRVVMGFTPFELLFLRFAIASVALLPVALFYRVRIPGKKDFWRIAITGIVGIGVCNICLNIGLKIVGSATASFIVSTGPIFVAILSVLFLKEKISISGWLFIFISFSGIGIIIIGESGGLQFTPGIFFVLLSAVAQAVYIVFQKPLFAKYSSVEMVCYSIWIVTLAMTPFEWESTGRFINADKTTMFTVLYLGIFPGAVAYLAWGLALSRVLASRAAPFLFIVPFFSIIIGYFWLHELPKPLAVAGGIVITLGLFFFYRSEIKQRQNI
jgi:drug/metabolite transporter (DMT)-like permease